MNVSLTFANTSPESLYVLYSTPPPPNSLQMSAGAANIELWWEPPTDTSVIGYYIYRRDTVSGLWQRLDPFPVSSATYLDEGLSARSVFYYRVSSVDIWNNEGPMCDSILAWTTLPYLSPWPKSVGASMQIYASPVLFDTDNDGAQEIFVAGKSYAAVWAFHADGSDVIDSTSSVDPFAITAWDGSTPAEMAIWGSPAIGDVDGDGIYELLVNDRHSSKKIHLFSISDGSEKAGWPVSVKSPTLSTPVLADLDGDGILEIINATYSGIEAYRADGSEYVPGSGGVLNELEPDLDGTFWSSPAIGDIDGDGHIEIVLGGPRDASNLGTVWVFDDSGGLKPGWPARIPFEDFSIGSPTIANFDSDTTTLEILLNGGWYGTYIFKNNGDIMPGWPQTGYHFSLYASNCAAADFDGDGICEVIAAGSSKLGLHYANGTAMPGWPIEIDGNSNYIGNPTIGDVDGDGEWEILYTIQNKIYGFEVSGQPMPNYPLKMADDCYGAPTLGDVNGDGNIDIVVGCYDSRVYVWETGAPYSPEALAWPTQKGNFHRTGLYGDFWRLERIKEHKQALPRCSDIKIYPNPFNSTVTLELRGVGATYRSPGQIAVEIFDISGRLVYAPSPSVPLPMGEGGQVLLPLGEGFRMRASPWEKVAKGRMRAFIWQPDESLPSGVYLVRATMEYGQTITKRIVLIK